MPDGEIVPPQRETADTARPAQMLKQFAVLAWHVAGRAAAQAPYAQEVFSTLADVERAALRAIRAHLEELDPAPALEVNAQLELTASPPEALRALLDRSMYTRPDESRNALYLMLLQDLLPDEARILAALSDGSAYPVIDVAEPQLGYSNAFALTNASTVGRAAGVSLPTCTPLYVSRLVRAGLATIGPEGADSMNDAYEMLMTDGAVNLAMAKARRGMRSARVIRRTVRISELGQEMWEAAK